MERKKRFIVSVTYYALFALLIYGGVKYALPVLMPFLLASGVVVLLRRPARELAGRAPGSERLWTFLLLAADYQRGTSAIIRFLPDRWGRTLREVRGKLTRSLGIYARSYVLFFSSPGASC